MRAESATATPATASPIFKAELELEDFLLEEGEKNGEPGVFVPPGILRKGFPEYLH